MIGVWDRGANAERLIDYPYIEMCTVIEGAVEITADGGQMVTYRAGDTFFMTKGLPDFGSRTQGSASLQSQLWQRGSEASAHFMRLGTLCAPDCGSWRGSRGLSAQEPVPSMGGSRRSSFGAWEVVQVTVQDVPAQRRRGRDAHRAMRAAPTPEALRPVRAGLEGGRYKPLSDADVQRICSAA